MCFSSVCISMLSWSWYVSVQHVFLCYPLLMLFQFSVYFHAILSKLCLSSACILALCLWCVQFSMYFHAILSFCCVSVQCVFPHYPVQAMFQFSMYFGAILMMCSVRIAMLSSPYAVFQFSVYFHTILSKQSTPSDMKSWPTKAPEDYIERSALRCFRHPFKSRILLTQVSPVCIWLYPDTLKLNSRCKYISHMVADVPYFLKTHISYVCVHASVCKCVSFICLWCVCFCNMGVCFLQHLYAFFLLIYSWLSH